MTENPLLFRFIRKAIEWTVIIIEVFHSCLLCIKFLSRMTPYANEIIGEYQCGFRRNRSTVDHIFTYLAFSKYLKRSGNTIRTYVSYL